MPVPILPTSPRFSWWRFAEIYPTGQFVPNAEDLVLMPNRTVQRVRHVDPVTHHSELEPYQLLTANGNEEDFVLAQTIDSFCIYVNVSEVPYVCAVDTRLLFTGSNSAYLKIFRGDDISVNGQVISGMINGLGQITSENVPMENVILPGTTNISAKTPVQFHLTELVNDNEPLYAVTYSATGVVTSVTRLIVRHTTFIRTLDASKNIVVSIELVSSYLSPTDDRLLEIPSNMVLQSANLRGRVIYANGSSFVLPVDGVKFRLFGIESYVASTPGVSGDLILAYYLGNDEFGVGLTGDANNRTKMEPYRIRTVEQSSVYAVKLFVAPYWDAPNSRYRLDYYLYSLDRQQFYSVTPFVENAVGHPVFDGTLFNVMQEVRVGIDLSDVAPSFAYYRHVQTFNIMLAEPATNNMTNNYWSLFYSNLSVYGQNMFATRDGSNNLRIDCGFGSVSSWLDNIYFALEPMRSLANEITAPLPTHVRLKLGTTLVRDIPISDVVSPITGVSSSIVQGSTIQVEFYRNDNGNFMELAYGTLNVKLI